jgi:hypothetical protein
MSYLSSVDGSLAQNVSAQDNRVERPLIIGLLH